MGFGQLKAEQDDDCNSSVSDLPLRCYLVLILGLWLYRFNSQARPVVLLPSFVVFTLSRPETLARKPKP